MNVALVSNIKYKKHLQPLISTWLDKGFRVHVEFTEQHETPTSRALQDIATASDAVMMLYPVRKSPAAMVQAPFLQVGSRKVVVGLVPVSDIKSLQNFTDTAVEVHRRKTVDQPVTLLAQRMPRYLQVTDRIYHELKQEVHPVFRWSSDLVFAGDMLYGINQGPSVCLYLGHGRPSGWSGYFGIRSHHITAFRNKPSAAIISLCCWTAARKRVKHSFCESLIMNGITPFAVGAVKPTLFTENTRWAINFIQAIRSGAMTAGELVRLSCPTQRSVAHYRFFGDPTVPLLADENFLQQAEKIKLYA